MWAGYLNKWITTYYSKNEHIHNNNNKNHKHTSTHFNQNTVTHGLLAAADIDFSMFVGFVYMLMLILCNITALYIFHFIHTMKNHPYNSLQITNTIQKECEHKNLENIMLFKYKSTYIR